MTDMRRKKSVPEYARKRVFAVEVTEHYHKVFHVRAYDEQEANDIIAADCDKYDCTTGRGIQYEQEINRIYPV